MLPETKEQIQQAQKDFQDHPFLVAMRAGTYPLSFAKKLVATQLGYNFEFTIALTLMRKNFANHSSFLCTFLDPHMMSEFGSDLKSVGLKQSGKTHIKMIYELAESLNMNGSESTEWGVPASIFFDKALICTIGGKDLAKALGALYADEILAASWLPIYKESFHNFATLNDMSLSLEFFDLHADEIEPSHAEHAYYLIDYARKKGMDIEAFFHGFSVFVDRLSAKFFGLKKDLD